MASKFEAAIKEKLNLARQVNHSADDAPVDAIAQGPELSAAASPQISQQISPELSSDLPFMRAVVLPLSAIEVRDQVRQQFSGIDALADDIAARGQRMPVEVEELATGRFLLITGERRFRALSLLAKRDAQQWGSIKALVVNDLKTQTERLVNQFNENVQRENLNPIEEAMALHQLMSLNKWNQKELAAAIAKGKAYVSSKLSLLKADEVTRQKLISGELSQKAFLQALADSQAAAMANNNRAGKARAKPREAKVSLSMAAVQDLCVLMQQLAEKQALPTITLSAQPSKKELMSIVETRARDVLQSLQGSL